LMEPLEAKPAPKLHIEATTRLLECIVFISV